LNICQYFLIGKEANMQRRLTFINLIVLVLLVLGGGGLAWYFSQHHNTINQTVQSATPRTIASNLNISTDGKTVSYEGVAGETALTTLRNLTSVQTQASSYGEFVTSINSLTANSSTQFWAFYVNGQAAAVGAGTYTAVQGDKIEWKLENL
jgi:hypothetical protein